MNTTAPAEGLGRRRPGPGPQSQGVYNSRPLQEGFVMSRMSLLSSPLLLGFEEMERLIDRVGKGGDGYPPYNIERIVHDGAGNGEVDTAEVLRITLAVAGFKREQLDITVEDSQLSIRGRQE